MTVRSSLIAVGLSLLIAGPQAIEVRCLHGRFMGGMTLRDREFRGRQFHPPLRQRCGRFRTGATLGRVIGQLASGGHTFID